MENSAFLSIWKEELVTEIMGPLELIGQLEAQCAELVEDMARLNMANPEEELTRAVLLSELQVKANEVKQLKADLALQSRFKVFKTITEHISLQP